MQNHSSDAKPSLGIEADPSAIWLVPATRQVLDSMTEFFVALNRNYDIVFVNRALAEASKIRHSELVGKNHWELWPDMRGTVVEASYARAFATGIPVPFEFHYPGSDAWLEVNAYPNGDYLHVYFRDITQHKRAEAEHRRREEDLEGLLTALPHIAWVTDAEGQPTYINSRWRDYTGRAGFSRDDVRDAIHPEDLERVIGENTAARETGAGRTYRLRLRRHDGAYRWFEVRSALLPGEGPIRVIGTTTDIHDEYLMREALRESENRYAAVFSEAIVGMSITDLTGRFTHANARFCEFVGRPLEALIGLHIGDVTFPADLPNNLELVRSAVETCGSYQLEKRYQRPDGSVVWVNSSVRVVADPDGRPSFIQAVSLDITERKEAEAALRRSEERFRAAVGVVGILWTNSPEGRMVGEQPGWSSLTGQPFEAYQGYGWADAVHPEDAQASLDSWQEAVRLRRSYVFEHRVRRHDGQWRRFSVRAVPVLDEAGEVREWVGVHLDVTEEREAVRALAESEAKLTSIVESVGDAFFALDREYRFVVFNPHAERFLDVDRASVIGRNAWEVFPMSVGTEMQRCIVEAMESRQVRHTELRSPKTGRWVEIHIYPWPDGIILFERDMTARKEAEDALQASEARLRFALEAAALGTWDFDVASGMTQYSDAVGPMFGRPRAPFSLNLDEVYGYVHPDDRFRLEDVSLALAERREPYRIRCRVVSEDGVVRWLETSGAPLLDAEGKVVGSSGVVADVTQRTLSEERLRESEARLQHALFAASAGVWHLDPIGKTTFWDETCYRLYGYEPSGGAPTFEMWTDRIHPEDRERTVSTLLGSLESKEPFRVEYRLLIPKVGQRWLVTAGGAIGTDGAFLTGITYDVTEERARVAALEATVQVGQALATEREAERIVQALTDASTAAIGADFGSFFYATPDSSGERFGLYVLSGAPREAFASFPAVRTTPLFTPTFRGEGTVRTEDVALDPRYSGMPPGHLAVRSYLAVPVRARNGEILGGLLFGHKEPGRFTVEHERLVEAFAAQAAIAYENAVLYGRLREANEDLERKVLERTAELQAANQQLEGFTYHVSHDLRAPLRAIVSTSRIVQDDFGDALPDAARAMLDRQAKAASKLGHLIDDLLKLSRLAREAIQKGPVDISELAREAAGEAISVHPATKVMVEVQEGLAGEADVRLLKLALLNLIENAVKYSPEGGTVRVGHREGTFFVADEGIGIGPQYLEKIFEPFHRLHRDDEFRGTGIGLTNVRQVIERHGGRVWAESERGRGTTFLFTLP